MSGLRKMIEDYINSLPTVEPIIEILIDEVDIVYISIDSEIAEKHRTSGCLMSTLNINNIFTFDVHSRTFKIGPHAVETCYQSLMYNILYFIRLMFESTDAPPISRKRRKAILEFLHPYSKTNNNALINISRDLYNIGNYLYLNRNIPKDEIEGIYNILEIMMAKNPTKKDIK